MDGRPRFNRREELRQVNPQHPLVKTAAGVSGSLATPYLYVTRKYAWYNSRVSGRDETGRDGTTTVTFRRMLDRYYGSDHNADGRFCRRVYRLQRGVEPQTKNAVSGRLFIYCLGVSATDRCF